jgi:hypothetical protein
MSLKSVLVLGPTGGFGQFIFLELIRRKSEFTRIGAFIDKTRPLDSVKAHTLQSYAEEGIEMVEGTPGDSAPFRGVL